MKKTKLLLPLIGLTALVPMVMPLVSCKKGGGDKPEPTDPLCFKAITESKVSYLIDGELSVGDSGDIDIEYKLNDSNWQNWELESGSSTHGEELTIKSGEKLYVRNTKNELSRYKNDTPNIFQFVMNTGEIETSGSVNSMINYSQLTDYCFSHLFWECSSLTTAPELPAATLANDCYSSMFFGCTSLTRAPELPATTLASHCYTSMFNGCSSLIWAPDLAATTLASNCYEAMFKSCSNLKIMETTEMSSKNLVLDLTDFAELREDETKNMFVDCDSEGFCQTPTVNHLYYLDLYEPLCFTDVTEDNTISSVSYCITKSLDIEIQYTFTPNIKESWSDWKLKEGDPSDSEVITLNPGQSIYVRNNKDVLSKGTIDGYFRFEMQGRIKASGSVNSMINYSKLKPGCFTRMFAACHSLIAAPELPATSLADSCYDNMFYDCTSLTQAPSLPITSTQYASCFGMFFDCASLTTPPVLDLSRIASFGDKAFEFMFCGCESLNVSQDNGTHPFVDFTNIDNPSGIANGMFDGTGGTFQGGTPNKAQYFWN